MELLHHNDSLTSTLPLDPLPTGFFSASSSSFGSLDSMFPSTPFQFPTFIPSSPSDNDISTSPSSSSPSSSPDSSPNSPISPSLNDGWNNGTSIMDPLRTKTMSRRQQLSMDPSSIPSLVNPTQHVQVTPPPSKNNRKRTQRNSKSTRGNVSKKGRTTKKTVGTKRKRSKTSSVSPSRSPSSSPSPTPERLPEESKAVSVPTTQFRELLQDAVLKKQRLQRKAELARISRQKKQMKMNELEAQVQALEEENRKLKAQLASTQHGECPVPKMEEQDETKKSIDKAVTELTSVTFSPRSPPASPSEDRKKNQQDDKVATLVGNVAQAFKDQTTNLDAALKVIEQALVPCTAIQFLEWAMMQKDKFYQDDGLFMSLFRDEMGATSQQLAQVLALRPHMQQVTKIKNQSLLDAFRNFETLLKTKGLQQPDSFNQLRAIFTPKQLAAYFKWVSLYGAVLIKVPV